MNLFHFFAIACLVLHVSAQETQKLSSNILENELCKIATFASENGHDIGYAGLDQCQILVSKNTLKEEDETSLISMDGLFCPTGSTGLTSADKGIFKKNDEKPISIEALDFLEKNYAVFFNVFLYHYSDGECRPFPLKLLQKRKFRCRGEKYCFWIEPLA